MYMQDLNSNVFVIDLGSGELVWEQRFDEPNLGPNGPAVGWGKLFAARGTQHVVALDLENGEVLWETQVAEQESVAVNIQPVMYNGMVYISTTAGGTELGNVSGNTLVFLTTTEEGANALTAFRAR